MVAWDNGILTDLSDHVHHKNGVKDDNRPENLEAMSPSDHHREHVAAAGSVTNQYGTWPLRSCTVEVSTNKGSLPEGP